MSPPCRFSDLGPFRLRIFSAQVGNRTRAHDNESNPLEISMSSAMKGEPGPATGLTRSGLYSLSFVSGSPVTETCVKRGSNRGQGPIRFLLLYRGSSPFTHCATSAGHTVKPVPVHTAPPVPALVAPYVILNFLKKFRRIFVILSCRSELLQVIGISNIFRR